MTTTNDLEDRLGQLRAEWPAGSMVGSVMARIGTAAPRRVRRTHRVLAGLAASGLAAALVLAWLVVFSHPATLLASVQDELKRARSAHLVITSWDDRGAKHRAEIWYRRGEGLRAESPEQVIVEDGATQWSWLNAARGETVVLRQRSPGFFTAQLPAMLALPDIPGDWARVRAPELDRVVGGRPCRGFTLTSPDQAPFRALVLAGEDGRIHEITAQERRGDGTWRSVREIAIECDAPVPAEKVAARLPAGARVVDRDEAFQGRFPLDRALHRVELGGLMLAVHDLQPLTNREGFYVVSSVRGTPEFLRENPPRRRPVNPETVALDVAFQPGANGAVGGKYVRVVLGSANRDGVEYSWWLVMPRRFFEVSLGNRVELPESDEPVTPGEPGRLDGVVGQAQVPLSATYCDEKHRDQRGVQQVVSTWAVVPLPADRPPTALDEVAARARRDLLMMGAGGAGGLLGVPADSKAEGSPLRPLCHLSPEAISDADFVAAVRRGIDDLRRLDEVRKPGPGDLQP